MPPPDFGVGLEGGIETLPNTNVGFGTTTATTDGAAARTTLWCMAWMAIVGTAPTAPSPTPAATSVPSTHPAVWGMSRTASFPLPRAIARLVLEEGVELGDADDRVFGRVGSKLGGGTVGFLTEGRIGRSAYYVHALELALVPFLWPEYFGGGVGGE